MTSIKMINPVLHQPVRAARPWLSPELTGYASCYLIPLTATYVGSASSGDTMLNYFVYKSESLSIPTENYTGEKELPST